MYVDKCRPQGKQGVSDVIYDTLSAIVLNMSFITTPTIIHRLHQL